LTARPWICRQGDERFDAELHLTDEGTRRLLADLLRRFAIWIARERSAAGAR
jgi:hypothetical protein